MDIVRYIGEGSAFRKIMLDEMDVVMSLPVSQIMRTEVVSVGFDCPLGDAAPLLKSSGVGAVLVKKDGSTIGIFTERDLLTALTAK
jgi:predicted transcriptional regulator